eukprot:scaffold561_cov306-Prasinococcus_capsulatus_cf.AAC.4
MLVTMPRRRRSGVAVAVGGRRARPFRAGARDRRAARGRRAGAAPGRGGAGDPSVRPSMAAPSPCGSIGGACVAEEAAAAAQWSAPGAADYITDPSNPTGFWPEYLQAVVDKMGEYYGRAFTIQRACEAAGRARDSRVASLLCSALLCFALRCAGGAGLVWSGLVWGLSAAAVLLLLWGWAGSGVYYGDSRLVTAAVRDGEVDMSEPYYLLSGACARACAPAAPAAGAASVSSDAARRGTARGGVAGFVDNSPRIEVFDFSCVTAGTTSKFFAPVGSGITSVATLVAALEAGNKAVGFIGEVRGADGVRGAARRRARARALSLAGCWRGAAGQLQRGVAPPAGGRAAQLHHQRHGAGAGGAPRPTHGRLRARARTRAVRRDAMRRDATRRDAQRSGAELAHARALRACGGGGAAGSSPRAWRSSARTRWPARRPRPSSPVGSHPLRGAAIGSGCPDPERRRCARRRSDGGHRGALRGGAGAGADVGRARPSRAPRLAALRQAHHQPRQPRLGPCAALARPISPRGGRRTTPRETRCGVHRAALRATGRARDGNVVPW